MEIERILGNYGAVSSYYDNFDELAKLVATKLAEGKVVGWFQGRMEYGPRAPFIRLRSRRPPLLQ